MTIAPTIRRHLIDQGADYELVSHPLSRTSSETAEAAHVSGDRIAKSVLVRDGDGHVLIVVPASHHVDLEVVASTLGRPVELATEAEIGRVFPDCELGAIPPIGAAYGLDVLLDAEVAGLDEVGCEGGDHRTLIRFSGTQFRALLADARRGRFSRHD